LGLLLREVWVRVMIQAMKQLVGLLATVGALLVGACNDDGGSRSDGGGVADHPTDAEQVATPALFLQLPTQVSDAVQLTWVPTPDNAFTTFLVYRADDISPGHTSQLIKTLSDPAARSYSDGTVTAATTYLYQIRGETAVGQLVVSNIQMVTVAPRR
jgi:hypothetical protein